MTALTFESISASPRRAAVRRNYRATLHVADKVRQPVTIAAIRPARDARKARKKIVLIAAIGVALTLHAALIVVLNRPIAVAPLPRKTPEMTFDIAPPPPPPPPVIQPKPLPQVATAKPVVRQPPPSVPVVQNVTENDQPSADTVQVATTPPPPAPVAAPPEPEAITEPKGYAGYLNNPAPSYPPAAQKRGLQGRVVLKIHVLANGQPDNVTIAKSSGYDILDEAAVKAVTAWAFDPAKRGQKPIDGWVNVPINFKLS